jgi:NAD(P)H-hydrate epimerase
VRSLLNELTVPCVIDADGLNALSIEDIARRSGGAPMILTPHPGEMSRLAGLDIKEVVERREEVARDVAARCASTVVLKGAPTVIADPAGELWVNPTGNSGMASGGTGDVLTGVAGSLLGQGVSATNAAVLASYVHGYAGDLAAQALGQRGMLAGDVMDYLPLALVEIEESGTL